MMNGDKSALAALLFIGAITNVVDVMSALNSSPWTAENFGADPDKAKSCKEYVMHSVAFSTGLTIAASLIAKSWWPVIGGMVANGYMYWLYNRALQRGQVAGSEGWAKN